MSEKGSVFCFSKCFGKIRHAEGMVLFSVYDEKMNLISEAKFKPDEARRLACALIVEAEKIFPSV